MGWLRTSRVRDSSLSRAVPAGAGRNGAGWAGTGPISLLLAGHLSDWAGRRRMLAVAIAVNVVSGVLFLTWPTVPGLLVARFVSGVSIGLLTATATAHLTELHRATGRAGGRASVVSTAANLGGIGLGPLLAGLLAQFAPDPLHLSYYVVEGLMLAGLLGLALVPETVTRPDPRPAYRPQRVSVPPASRQAFWAAGATAAVMFSVFGLFTSLAPSFLAGTLRPVTRNGPSGAGAPAGTEASDLDTALFAALAADGRTPYADLAVAADWSETRVRRRLDQLREGRALYYDLELDSPAFGFRAMAWLWLSVPPAHLADVERVETAPVIRTIKQASPVMVPRP